MLTQELIEALRAPFPAQALKPDTSRGFELTSIKAAYVIERLNDVFGPCGTGWEYSGEEHWSEPIFACGGKGLGRGCAPYTDARKSAVTDGLTKVASMIGVDHQVFKGLVRTGRQKGRGNERGQRPQESPGPTARPSPRCSTAAWRREPSSRSPRPSCCRSSTRS